MTLSVRPYGEDIGGVVDRLLEWLSRRPVTEWVTFRWLEFFANIAMFVPLGVFVVLWFGVRRWWLAPPTGFALSAAIEIAQLQLLPSRFADPRDLVANTTGAVLGAAAMVFLWFLLTSAPARRRR
ncbi:VanZ family protein [Microbacterium saccharophilum]|uniref:VanZ family protein n=2 Tax=Microbacterium saccharophilum TaxID=1213358 RepID=A0A5C8I7U5_9MICO|nr:VanZ family protein [Microbacterium saccharophilum]